MRAERTVSYKSTLPIGVLDTGVGGLTVLNVLRKSFPEDNFLYLGDSLNNPYGNHSAEEITALSLRMADFMVAQPVKMLVIACNTITVTALDSIMERCNMPVIGMCKGMRRAIHKSAAHRIGVMATAATIQSHKHKLEAMSLDSSVLFYEQSCPDLAQLIEEGHVDDSLIRHTLTKYLTPLMDNQVDTIVHGCTHYPFVEKMMAEITKRQVVFVDPAYETVEAVCQAMDRNGLYNRSGQGGRIELCFTAHEERARKLAHFLMPEATFTTKTVTI